MAMTRQHFEMFAQIIRIAREHGTWDDNLNGLAETIEMVCAESEKDNPRFDRARFMAACEEQTDRRKPLPHPSHPYSNGIAQPLTINIGAGGEPHPDSCMCGECWPCDATDELIEDLEDKGYKV